MNLEILIDNLKDDNNLNQTLTFLEEIIVEKNDNFIKIINDLIKTPEKIQDTNKFASLLVDLKVKDFIPNLISKIKEGNPTQTPWLADYMYSLGEILEDLKDYYEVDDTFIELLGNWLLNTNGGEISWKSGIILSNLKNNKLYNFLVKGVKSQNLFLLTRSHCLNRIVNEYGKTEIKLLESLLNDKDQDFLDLIKEAIERLNLKK